MTMATMTGGTIAGYALLAGLLICCLLGIWWGIWLHSSNSMDRGAGKWIVVVSLICVPISFGLWWWGMAFTMSPDYHAWNVKAGQVDKVSKRLIATDSGMSERYVVTMNGEPFGIDDTRATLIEKGDRISLRCKKDYQWGVPREAHGWACRWNGAAA